MLQSTTDGFVLGGAYALVALGFVTLFNTTNFFNFAHGDFLTLGAYLAYTFKVTLNLAWPLELLLVAVALGLVGLLTERLTRSVVRRRALLVGAIATLGLGLIIRAVLQVVYGTDAYSVPPLVSKPAVHVFGAALSYQQLIILAFAIVVVVLLYWVYQHTFIGLILKATAEDPTAAQIMGVPTGRVVKAAFAVSAALAGLAGAFLVSEFSASLEFGYLIVFIAVVGAMVGGFGSLVGAVIGCLIVGIVQVDASYLINANYQNIAVYGLLVLLFIARPVGIFGTRLVEKV
jgi:branched-chain amino acid transport system permease protein